MTSISKNLYIDKLDDIVKKYNNIHHRTITMKPGDVKSKAYINFNKENNYKDPKFKVFDYMRISKYKNIFAKGYISNWSEEVFVFKKVINTVDIFTRRSKRRRNHWEFLQKEITKKCQKRYWDRKSNSEKR